MYLSGYGEPLPTMAHMEEKTWYTLDGHKLVRSDEDLQTLEVTPIDGVCTINLKNISSIDGMIVPKHVESVDLMAGYNLLIRTTPKEDGSVVFWKNWNWVNHSAFDAKIVIKSDMPLIVKFHIKNEIKFVPIYVEGQTFVPSMFKNTEYNNALLFMDGLVVLRYLN